MEEDLIKVQTFVLTNIDEKVEYERLLNTYEKIKEEFGFMRDGTPKVVLWYAVPKDR